MTVSTNIRFILYLTTLCSNTLLLRYYKKQNCQCASHKLLNMISVYLTFAIIWCFTMLCLFITNYDLFKYIQNKVFPVELVLVITYVIASLYYTYIIEKKQCKCANTAKRLLSQLLTTINAIVFSFVGLGFISLGVVSFTAYKIRST